MTQCWQPLRLGQIVASFLAFSCSALGLAPLAHAHGPTPAVVAIAADSATAALSPTAFELTNGLALQVDGAYRHVCPATWGDDNTWPASSVQGQIVVAGSRGLYLVDAAGHVTPHPDPNAKLSSIALAATPGALFVLAVDGQGSSSIARVTATAVTPLWTDAHSWQSLAAGPDFLMLLRSDTNLVATVKLSLEGQILEQGESMLMGASYVSARVAGGVMYGVVSTPASFLLGRFDHGAWQQLATARAQIAGPVLRDNTKLYVGIDGALETLDGQQLTMLDAAAGISCLGRNDTRSYACTADGIHELTDTAVGAPLLLLQKLKPPLLAGLPPDVSETCELQWEHLVFDLLSAGITVEAQTTMPTGSTTDASMPSMAGMSASAGTAVTPSAGTFAMAAPDASVPDASMSRANGAGAASTDPSGTAGAQGYADPTNMRRSTSSGCSVSAPTNTDGSWTAIVILACAWLLQDQLRSRRNACGKTR